MPQEISGLAGTISSGAQQLPMPNVADLAQIAMALKGQKIQQASQSLNTMLELMKVGVFPDESEFRKVVKDIGVKLPTNEGAPLPASVGAQDITSAGRATEGSRAGVQAATPPTSRSAPPGGGVPETRATAPGTGAIESGVSQARTSWFDQLKRQTQERLSQEAAIQGATNRQRLHLLEMADTSFQRFEKSGGRDMQALGQMLMASGQPVPSPDTLTWMGFTPEQREKFTDIQLGAMTPTQKEQMRGQLTGQAMANILPKLQNPSDITKVVDALADHKDFPNVAMKPDLDEMTNRAKLIGTYTQYWGKWGRMMAEDSAKGLDPFGRIPPGAKDLYTMEYEQKSKDIQASIAANEAQIMHYKSLMEAARAKQSAQEFQDTLDLIKSLGDAEKTKLMGRLPASVRNEMYSTLAKRLGMTPQTTTSEARKLVSALTLGLVDPETTEFVASPGMTEEEQRPFIGPRLPGQEPARPAQGEPTPARELEELSGATEKRAEQEYRQKVREAERKSEREETEARRERMRRVRPQQVPPGSLLDLLKVPTDIPGRMQRKREER